MKPIIGTYFRFNNEEVELYTVNYKGCEFDDFFVQRGNAPGWFVWGRNKEEYGTKEDGKGAYVMICARPNVKPRRHPHYNNPVRRGWHTKREAQAVADALNSGKIKLPIPEWSFHNPDEA